MMAGRRAANAKAAKPVAQAVQEVCVPAGGGIASPGQRAHAGAANRVESPHAVDVGAFLDENVTQRIEPVAAEIGARVGAEIAKRIPPGLAERLAGHASEAGEDLDAFASRLVERFFGPGEGQTAPAAAEPEAAAIPGPGHMRPGPNTPERDKPAPLRERIKMNWFREDVAAQQAPARPDIGALLDRAQSPPSPQAAPAAAPAEEPSMTAKQRESMERINKGVAKMSDTSLDRFGDHVAKMLQATPDAIHWRRVSETIQSERARRQ